MVGAIAGRVLEQAHADFQALAVDLPFGQIGHGREQTVRERFSCRAPLTEPAALAEVLRTGT